VVSLPVIVVVLNAFKNVADLSSHSRRHRTSSTWSRAPPSATDTLRRGRATSAPGSLSTVPPVSAGCLAPRRLEPRSPPVISVDAAALALLSAVGTQSFAANVNATG
jgi:hypothetical protein